MTKHKCFISFKVEDKAYKEKIQANKNIDMIDKSLNEPIDSDNPDYVMQKIRDDNLKDSSVTIFLIGSVSAEIIGKKEQYYIVAVELGHHIFDPCSKFIANLIGLTLEFSQN
ncbi:TIR domain-containing protein [Lacticaseibacillus paracasei]|uniref:TIR domain-containing protein n=1 Tax=Lacticaseibacillus paracasei TaxID=1597 RepID=UPI0009B99D8A|nr:TIR domain-containing protein [Lacticaseibacillus paracasei]